MCHCLVVVMGSVALLGSDDGWCQVWHCLAVVMGGVALLGSGGG